MAKVGINGFGRIGRIFLRAALEKKLEVVAINQPNRKPNYLAYLLKHDSVHGRFEGDVCSDESNLIVCGQKICVFSESEPKKVPWKQSGAEYIVECSGRNTTMDKAKGFLEGGAKKVIVSAPSKDIPMYLPGVNMKNYKSSDQIVSMASCTTNCTAPMAKVLQEAFGIEEALLTTVHAVTGSQNIVDAADNKDWRLGRSGMQNIIPTSTGAAEAVTMVIPELKGKMTGMAIRVPVPNVSVVDLTLRLCSATDFENVKCEMRKAAENELRGLLCYTEEEIVSTDVIGSGCSCIFDANACICLNNSLMKLIAWYDNEYGYSSRLVDLVKFMYKTDSDACAPKKKEITCGTGVKGGKGDKGGKAAQPEKVYPTKPLVEPPILAHAPPPVISPSTPIIPPSPPKKTPTAPGKSSPAIKNPTPAKSPMVATIYAPKGLFLTKKSTPPKDSTEKPATPKDSNVTKEPLTENPMPPKGPTLAKSHTPPKDSNLTSKGSLTENPMPPKGATLAKTPAPPKDSKLTTKDPLKEKPMPPKGSTLAKNPAPPKDSNLIKDPLTEKPMPAKRPTLAKNPTPPKDTSLTKDPLLTKDPTLTKKNPTVVVKPTFGRKSSTSTDPTPPKSPPPAKNNPPPPKNPPPKPKGKK